MPLKERDSPGPLTFEAGANMNNVEGNKARSTPNRWAVVHEKAHLANSLFHLSFLTIAHHSWVFRGLWVQPIGHPSFASGCCWIRGLVVHFPGGLATLLVL